jgi:hypothetical protein
VGLDNLLFAIGNRHGYPRVLHVGYSLPEVESGGDSRFRAASLSAPGEEIGQ